MQKITDKNGRPLGVLCLSFKFEDELKQLSISLKIDDKSANDNLVLLNEKNECLFEREEHNLPKVFPEIKKDKLEIMNLNGMDYFVYLTVTQGYQGFKGLPWSSVNLIPVNIVLREHLDPESFNLDGNSALYPQDLNQMNLEISTALLIVVLNGKIISLKKKLNSFLPILDSFQEIGAEVRNIFASSIHHIHQISHQTLSQEVSFLAKIAMDIMDRNLYERANDCRWWALNSKIRSILLKEEINSDDKNTLSLILKQINDLYTVYTQLFLVKHEGVVVALSNPKDNHLLGTDVSHYSGIKEMSKIKDPQLYAVSQFEKTPIYDGLETYIYYAPVNTEDGVKNLGGIGVVFDSLPEFKAILQDFLPKDAKGNPLKDSFGMFIVDKQKIISVTDNQYGFEVGSHFSVEMSDQKNMENGVFECELNGIRHLVGYQRSKGYREYKNNDGYVNNVMALVFTKL